MKVYSFIKSSAKSVRFFAAMAAATMVGGFTTAMVMAAIPSSSGDVSACYNNSSGILKVIDAEASATCAINETPINWGSNATLSKRASFEPTDPVSTLLVIPGFGSLMVDPAQCNADNMTQAPIDYKNTTGSTMILAGPESGNLNPLNTNDTYRIGAQTAGYGNDQYFLSPAANTNSIASMRIAGYAPTNSNATACTYYVQVTYNK